MAASSSRRGDGELIVFMDVETTVPFKTGKKHSLLEFGAILVCARTLTELDHYSTLIKPSDLASISKFSSNCNGITREAVADAPTFLDVADTIYGILHGRVWAGHNILRFDCLRIREAFADISRPGPEPKGTIDTLPLLTHSFGRRAGDMKMASLAKYFCLGQQKHRSLEDVRMNLEVLKHCATVLFLESCHPDISNGNDFLEGTSPDPSIQNLEFGDSEKGSSGRERNCEVLHVNETTPPVTAIAPLDMAPLMDQMKIHNSLPSYAMHEVEASSISVQISGTDATSECSSRYAEFLDPDKVLLPSISTYVDPAYEGGPSRILLLHDNILLQIHCTRMKIHFGVSSKFVDRAGRPRLSLVVDSSPSLCRILDWCDHLMQISLLDSASTSEWKPTVMRKNGSLNSSTVRLLIPIVGFGGAAAYSTEIYQRETSGNIRRLVFNKVDIAELDSIFIRGSYVDACISLDVYDYQQHAGIRLLAKKLIVRSR